MRQRRCQRRAGAGPDVTPTAPSNRVTGPRDAVSSINPRRIVHFRFRRESRLTRKIALDRARRDHPVDGGDCRTATVGRNGARGRAWNGMTWYAWGRAKLGYAMATGDIYAKEIRCHNKCRICLALVSEIIRHLYSAPKSEDAKALVASG